MRQFQHKTEPFRNLSADILRVYYANLEKVNSIMHFKKIPLNFNFDGWYRLTEVLNLYRKRKFHRTDL